MKRIVITDLTRFNSGDDVCTAGTDMESGLCIRPMPYLKASTCKKLGILPGAILVGDFVPNVGLVGPHQEDASYTPGRLSFDGASSSDEFRKALESRMCDSIEEGFDIKLSDGQKHVPIGHRIGRSIVTLAVEPDSIEIIEDQYSKIKIHFTDGSGRSFAYFPITDLGFHHYADAHRAAKDLQLVNDFIRAQPEAFLRVGLSRAWQNPRGIKGYWMQVNGVYTFPEFFKGIRSFK